MTLFVHGLKSFLFHNVTGCFNYRTSTSPMPSTEPHPTCLGQVGRSRGNRPLATRRGHTHTTTKCLLPRFRKVVARSTIPDGKENERRRKLKTMQWDEWRTGQWLKEGCLFQIPQHSISGKHLSLVDEGLVK